MFQKVVRIQLVISEASQPDLFKYLEACHKMGRADRVRFLSELGLLCMNGKLSVSDMGTVDVSPVGGASRVSSTASAPETSASAGKIISPAKKKALSRLSAGFQDQESTAKR